MTDEQFLNWLRADAVPRVVLIEADAQVGGVETTFYMSTKGGYATFAGEVPANEIYHAIASVGVLYTEQLSTTGGGALAAGEVYVENFNGVRDAWTSYVWTNRRIRAWVGDQRWPRADFRLIFDGIIADIAPGGTDKLVIKLRDKLQRLNTPVSDLKLGGSTLQGDVLIPLAFGECHNVTPLLADSALLVYQLHAGQIERIIEVRDNGYPIANDLIGWGAVSVDLANGKFTLLNAPAGAITCDVQGDKFGGVYSVTVASLVKRIVTGFGNPADRFALDDLDEANLSEFESNHPQPVGIYLTERTNVLAACEALAGSLGAQLLPTRTGRLRLNKLSLPAAGEITAIHPTHMVDGQLTPVTRSEVIGAARLGFNKNWTVQEGLVTDIPEEHKALFAAEWLTTTKTAPAVQTTYRLTGEPVQQGTMLLRKVDADPEAQRLVDLWSVPRETYEFQGVPEMLLLELGDAVQVFHPRFGFSAGRTGMVLQLAPDWLNVLVKVGFIV